MHASLQWHPWFSILQNLNLFTMVILSAQELHVNLLLSFLCVFSCVCMHVCLYVSVYSTGASPPWLHRVTNQSPSFSSLHLHPSECMRVCVCVCVCVCLCWCTQPSPLDSCSWINIVYFLIEQGEHWGPELSLLSHTHAYTHKHTRTYARRHNMTRIHRHILRERVHTGIIFISYNHLI